MILKSIAYQGPKAWLTYLNFVLAVPLAIPAFLFIFFSVMGEGVAKRFESLVIVLSIAHIYVPFVLPIFIISDLLVLASILMSSSIPKAIKTDACIIGGTGVLLMSCWLYTRLHMHY